MKQQFTGTYTFTPSSGVVTLDALDLPLERLYLIVNTTRNTPIYNFAVSGLGATRTFASGNTSFDVAFDTSAHNANDRLTIIYDDGVSGAHGPITTASAELTTSSSTEILAQPAAPAVRRYLLLQNLSTAPIFVNFTNAATTTSMRLDAGSSLSFEGNFIPNNSLNLLRSGTANQRYFLMHATY